MNKILILLIISAFSMTSAFAIEVIDVQKTAYGAKIKVGFEKDVRLSPFRMGYWAKWVKKVGCDFSNERLIARIELSRELFICRDGRQCQTESAVKGVKTLKIHSDELCDEGIPKMVFVNGVQVI